MTVILTEPRLCGVPLVAWGIHPQADRRSRRTVCLTPILITGLAGWLALAAWLASRDRGKLAAVSELVGSVTFLATPLLLAPAEFGAGWQRTLMEVITFVTSVSFIVASVRLQSRILLYNGATFLPFFITYLDVEHFADEIGMPVAVFIAGASLTALGLGASWLGRTMDRGALR